jgi:hypothetical protein
VRLDNFCIDRYIKTAVERAALRGSKKLSFHSAAFSMYILYLDDAGSVRNADDRYFILAGIALFERQIYFLQKALNELALTLERVDTANLEFHANAMHAGRGRWRAHGRREERRAHMVNALKTGMSLQGRWRLFGVVVEKSAISPEDPTEYAFEQLCNRFDRFLGRMHNDGNTQRGLIVLDKSTRETRLQTLATEFRANGHRWGNLRNLVDVPFFVDSQATRIIQYADLVAYALWRKYQHHDDEFYDLIKDRFDVEGGVVHGLHVLEN